MKEYVESGVLDDRCLEFAYQLQIDLDESSLPWLRQGGKVLQRKDDELGGKIEGFSNAGQHSTVIPMLAPTLQGKTTLIFKEKQIGLRRLASIETGPHLHLRRNTNGFMTGLEWYWFMRDAVVHFAKKLRRHVGVPDNCPVLVMYDACGAHSAGQWVDRIEEIRAQSHLKFLEAVKGGTPLCNVPDALFAAWKARSEKNVSELIGLQDDLRERPQAGAIQRGATGRRKSLTAEVVANAVRQTTRSFPPSYVLHAFVKQRKVPYQMMCRLLGCTAEGAAAERQELDAETSAAHMLDQHKSIYTNGQGGPIGRPQKRRRQDQTEIEVEREVEDAD